MDSLDIAALEQRKLLEEYRVNLELWKHADIIRQSKAHNFLNVNAGLLAFLGGLLAVKPSMHLLGAVAFSIAFFGAYLCEVWRKSQRRNAAYALMHRHQLRMIEHKLGGIDTFSNLWTVLYGDGTVNFGPLIGSYSDRKSTTSSTNLERWLPVMLTLYWLFIAACGIAAILIPDIVRALIYGA